MSTELYRRTKLGDSLVSALEDLLDKNKLTTELAIKVLSEVCTSLAVLKSTVVSVSTTSHMCFLTCSSTR